MNSQRTRLLICYGVGMLGCFLPWMHAPMVGSVNGTQGDGVISLGLFAVSLALVLLGDRSQRVSGWKSVVAQLCGVGASIVPSSMLLKVADMKSAGSDNVFAQAVAEAVGTDIGVYIVLLAGFVAIPLARMGAGSESPSVAQASA